LKIIAGPILDLQWSDDSKRIIAVGEGKEKFGAVVLWDTGSSVGEISGHSKFITSCDFKQTRPYRVATGSEDFLTCWFEGPPFKFGKSLKDHTRFVNCVRFSPDGTKLATVSSDKNGFIYDGKTGDQLAKMEGHTAGIYSCSWSPDSKYIITASGDKTSMLWDASNGKSLKTFKYSNDPQVEHQQVGSVWVGNEVITLSLGGDLTVLDIENPSQHKRVIKGHNKFITALAYDKNTNALYSGSYDANILKWDANTGITTAFSGKGHTNQINRLFVQGDWLISASMDDTIRITSLNSLEYGQSVSVEGAALDIAVSKKSNKPFIAVALNSSIVVIADGKVTTKLAVKYQPTSIALNQDETAIAVGSKDNLIYLYNLHSGSFQLTESHILKGHRGALSCLAYSQDGQYLASADLNRDIFVWDLNKNEIKIQGWVFHNARVNSLNWSPDSLHLVSGSLDNSLYIWDVQNPQKRISVKDGHPGGVNATLWIDNNTIASAGQDCTIKTWTVSY